MSKKYFVIFLICILGFQTNVTFGQSRSVINDGVDKYEKGDFAGASEKFQKSIDEKFENYKGHFNLGDALYKQEKYEDALNSYKNAMALAETDNQKAEVFHNVGNALLKSQKLKESIGAYTESLKLNPDDLETKYNLSYALKQMQQQEKNKDKNDKKKDDQKKDDQKKDQKKDDQKKDDKEKEDNKNQQNKDKNDDKKNDQKQDKEQQQPPPEISKEEAKRILDALKDDEADMQKELRKKKGKKVKVEKDW